MVALVPSALARRDDGIEPGGRLRVVSNRRRTEPKPGWTVIALVPPAGEAASPVAAA